MILFLSSQSIGLTIEPLFIALTGPVAWEDGFEVGEGDVQKMIGMHGKDYVLQHFSGKNFTLPASFGKRITAEEAATKLTMFSQVVLQVMREAPRQEPSPAATQHNKRVPDQVPEPIDLRTMSTTQPRTPRPKQPAQVPFKPHPSAQQDSDINKLEQKLHHERANQQIKEIYRKK